MLKYSRIRAVEFEERYENSVEYRQVEARMEELMPGRIERGLVLVRMVQEEEKERKEEEEEEETEKEEEEERKEKE
ncbi:hypothetical protein E2C01_065400 [Portunus trituberculatus]|uniref:Uncharacterized protein n=1 Tax=Portunus trituberculatus TaxID=210409 RepID=A0A5B7HFI2_PORTR|nr:hypothetical protein [Portunus trituberculatus]